MSRTRGRPTKRHAIERAWRGGGSLNEVIAELVAPLRLREAVELIEVHSGVSIDVSTLHRWVRREREHRT